MVKECLAKAYKEYISMGLIDKANAIFKGNVPNELIISDETGDKTRGRPKKADSGA